MGGAFSNCEGENGDLFRGFLTDNKDVYEVQPIHPRHHGKLKQLDKRSGEKSNYHIITKKDIAGFRLPDMVGSKLFSFCARDRVEDLSILGPLWEPKRAALGTET